MRQNIPINQTQAAKIRALHLAFASAEADLLKYVDPIADGAGITKAAFLGVGGDTDAPLLCLEVPDPAPAATAAPAPERVRRGQRAARKRR